MNYTTDYLRKWHADIRTKNPAYSLRAFAGKLGLSVGALSEYLSGRRQPTQKTIETIIQNLSEHEQYIGDKLHHLYEKDQLAREGHFDLKNKLSNEDFSQINEWPYFAILALIETTDFTPDPQWISMRLGMPPEKVQEVLLTLTKLGLIKKENKNYVLTTELVYAINDGDSSAQAFHRQLFAHVAQKMEETPMEFREINALMIPIRMDRLPEARERIHSFLKDMAGIMDMAPRSEVYNLSVQLVPLSKCSKN